MPNFFNMHTAMKYINNGYIRFKCQYNIGTDEKILFCISTLFDFISIVQITHKYIHPEASN